MSNDQVRAINPTENRNTHIEGTASAGVRFTNLDDALLHAEALLANGYDQHGKWTLGQICDHLVKFVNFITWQSRLPLGRPMLSVIVFLFFLGIPLGTIGSRLGLRIPTFRHPATRQPLSDAQGVIALRDSIRGLKSSGPLASIRMNTWHCQHHLNYLRMA